VSVESNERPQCSEKFSRGVLDVAIEHGADDVSITSAEPFEDIQTILEERKEAGIAGTMQFTYRNPYRSTHPEESLPGASTLVVCIVSYAHDQGDEPDRPYARVAQYATIDSREKLLAALTKTADHLRNAGWRSLVLSDDNSLVDRAAAMRAGIGFYGKNALIINKKWGSTVLIGSVLTTAPLRISQHVDLKEGIEGCGACTACMPACPTGAITSPGVVDGRKCLSWIAQAPDDISHEHRIAMGNRIYGCDECQDACPYNKIQFRRTDKSYTRPSFLDVEFLLTCSDEELMETAGEWYVYKRDPRYLRRNALIIAGNTLNIDDSSWSHVEKWSRSDDNMLQEYASWALSQRN
jgi:epoxyqueuosine reductase